MKKSKTFVMGASLLACCSVVQADSEGEGITTNKEVGVICSVLPDLCLAEPTGPGNGGGKEPPVDE